MIRNPFQVVRLSWQVFYIHFPYSSHLEFSLLVLKCYKDFKKKKKKKKFQNVKIKTKFPNPFITEDIDE